MTPDGTPWIASQGGVSALQQQSMTLAEKALFYSGNGRQLASGTVFLLPYYMGRYHGFIEEN